MAQVNRTAELVSMSFLNLLATWPTLAEKNKRVSKQSMWGFGLHSLIRGQTALFEPGWFEMLTRQNVFSFSGLRTPFFSSHCSTA